MGKTHQLKKMGIRHTQILHWLTLNPGKSLRECADHFEMTPVWISGIVRSDIFQAALRKQQMQIAARVTSSIPERLTRLADVGLDKLSTMVEQSEDPDFVLEATDKVLHRLGYAPASSRNPSPPGQQNIQQNFFVGADDLARARATMGQRGARGEEQAERPNSLVTAEVGSVSVQVGLPDPNSLVQVQQVSVAGHG